jgi:hypothetical protein
VDLVRSHTLDTCVDIGIGSGQFVDACSDCYGYDVSPQAEEWLERRGRWFDPYDRRFPVATFWDSLEHIPDPEPILSNVARWAFVAMPIYRDVQHVVQSKHFRPGEHCWYFTRDGLIGFMAEYGFECVLHDTRESLLGREDIHSFAFKRVTKWTR